MKTRVPIRGDKYFDRIYCIHYLPREDRMDRLIEELKRVGIYSSGLLEMRYTCPSKYDKIIFKEYHHTNYAPVLNCVNICLEARKILSEAIYFEYQRILLLEDDVAFLRDLEEVRSILENMPEDGDIFQFDKFVWDNGWMKEEWENRIKNSRKNKYFLDGSGTLFTSAACMGLSNKGIKEMLSVMDKRICPIDVSPLLMKNSKYYVAIRNIAIQDIDAGSESLSIMPREEMENAYKNGGVDFSLYQLGGEK